VGKVYVYRILWIRAHSGVIRFRPVLDERWKRLFMKRITKRALTLAGGAVLAGTLAPTVTASAATSAPSATARAITIVPLTPARAEIRGGTAAPASGVTLDSSSGDVGIFTLCALGNYATYLKVIQDSSSARSPLVSNDNCVEFSVTFFNEDKVEVYDFGIYNVSKLGFDVNVAGGPVATIPAGAINPQVLIDAEGTTTAPFGQSTIDGMVDTF
jgi:hypothetical protein